MRHRPADVEAARFVLVRCRGGDAEACPELGVLHIDAHHDLRDAYEGFHWWYGVVGMVRCDGVLGWTQLGVTMPNC